MNTEVNNIVDFSFNKGASLEAIRNVELLLGHSLPEDYTAFLCRANGGDGFVNGHYLMLWKIEDLKQMNDGYETAIYFALWIQWRWGGLWV